MTSPKTPIRKRSKKRAAQEREYLKRRAIYIASFPICQVCRANESTDIHHRAGRSGDRLLDVSLFLAVCRICHNDIERNPLWAKKLGYSLSRLAK